MPTGTCLILVTPDSERTMCTFLGTAGKINENDVDTNAIKQSEIIFLEGYLWDEGDPKKAFDKAITNANKVAMSLSDQFCVDRHKPHFLNLVKNKLDITFANEQEIMSLIDAKNFDEVINFGKGLKKLLIITRGEKGAISINGDEVTECGVQKNGLTKSTMKLIFEEKEFKKLLSNLKIEKTVSGGSVANSIVGLSQLKNKVGFIGKVSDD